MNETIRVAFQGEAGAFSETAAHRLAGDSLTTVPCPTFEDTFAAVTGGHADCCVVPIENSLAGSIHRNYDLLLESNLTIVGETNLRIVHNLIAASGTTLAAATRVYSHPVALAQCTRFLRANPRLEAMPVHDTAGAVRMVMERGCGDEVAIASDRAAEIYGGTVLATGIEDHAQNFTRFLLVTPPDSEGLAEATPLRFAQRRSESTRRWKTSLILRIADKPGALFRALGAFALVDIDLAKIESRPIEGRPWEYAFYLDVVGRPTEQPLARALDNLQSMAEMVRVLGSYPTKW
jgi:prephenate dehydratase